MEPKRAKEESKTSRDEPENFTTQGKQELEPRRKKYKTPRLIRYGTVEDLTWSGGSTQPDAHQAKQHHPGQGGGEGND